MIATGIGSRGPWSCRGFSAGPDPLTPARRAQRAGACTQAYRTLSGPGRERIGGDFRGIEGATSSPLTNSQHQGLGIAQVDEVARDTWMGNALVGRMDVTPDRDSRLNIRNAHSRIGQNRVVTSCGAFP